ncbi:MAG: hypothetical protein AAB766_04160 [Patescibacteria group bacterium]
MTKAEFANLKKGDILQRRGWLGLNWVVVIKQINGDAHAVLTAIVRESSRKDWKLFNRDSSTNSDPRYIPLIKNNFRRLKVGDELLDEMEKLFWVIVMKTEIGEFVVNRTFPVRENECFDWTLVTERVKCQSRDTQRRS